MSDAEDKIMQRIWRLTQTLPWSGCWLFVGSLSSQGYGKMWIEGKQRHVATIAYEIMTGSPVGNRLLCHCKVSRACWNPGHLRFAAPINVKKAAQARERLIARINE